MQLLLSLQLSWRVSIWTLESVACQLVHCVLAYMTTCLKGIAASGNAHFHVCAANAS